MIGDGRPLRTRERSESYYTPRDAGVFATIDLQHATNRHTTATGSGMIGALRLHWIGR